MICINVVNIHPIITGKHDPTMSGKHRPAIDSRGFESAGKRQVTPPGPPNYPNKWSRLSRYTL